MEKNQIKLQHLGIIADGNRRWAKKQGLPRIEGHRRGLKTIEELIGGAMKVGIPYLSFYVFSTENWGREKSEVDYIMKMIETQIIKMAEKMKKNDARLLVLGSKENVDPKLISLMEKAEKITADCKGITIGFCFNYGGEQEIADAAKKTVNAGEELTPKNLRKHLYHPEIPDLDMIVRTSGEERISGFMLWRAAYAELLFLDKYFPEMSEDDMGEILEKFEKRERRFGK